MSCQHDCAKPPAFPRTIYNRPGLGAIDYRVGTYAVLRAYLLDRIDKRPELSGWTHRQADDPGIALLEGGAVVGDILTFYQQVYANEAFLRTTQWQESVFELVRLLGYRPAPGVGGLATFAAIVKGDGPIVIPAGFGFKVKLEGQDQQSEFESSDEVAAWPHLSEFRLYRPRLPERNITPAVAGNQLELKAVGGSTALSDIAALEIRPGDRIMLVPPSQMFDVTGTTYSLQQRSEILIVSDVKTLLDRVIVTFEGAITQSRGATVDAYLLGRSFRHFGHDAPPLTTVLSGNPQVASFNATRFTRRIWGNDNPSSNEANYYSPILREEMPLDKEVGDLAAGGALICEGAATFDGQPSEVPFIVVRAIVATRSDSLTWGNKSGGTTVVTLDQRLIANLSILNEVADIRKVRFHETLSPRLTLRAPTAWTSGGFTNTKLNFLGTLEEVWVLAGRQLMLKEDATGRTQQVAVLKDLPSLSGAVFPADARMWQIELDRAPEFTLEDFDEAEPAVIVYGNLVASTQGKSQSETVIGSGDARQQFQTFALPKDPLTFLLDRASSPPQVPELSIYVGGVLWNQVDMLFGNGTDDRVYVVRQDEEGKSLVQFGNGVMGSRLPSGRNNVTAVFRVGISATGVAAKDPQAAGKVDGLDKVRLPSAATGGAEAETAGTARVAAPGKMQSLGRLVSLSDFEAEALTIPGVSKARAYWSSLQGVPLIEVVVLTESGAESDLEFVRDTMAGFNRCRGPARHAIAVTGGVRQYLHIALTVGYDPARKPEDVERAVQQTLGIGTDDGLFSLSARMFGESAHVSQVIGRVQQADGVRWAEADAAQPIPLGSPPQIDPAMLAIPAIRFVRKTLICLRTRVLALDTSHFELNLVADDRQEACSR